MWYQVSPIYAIRKGNNVALAGTPVVLDVRFNFNKDWRHTQRHSRKQRYMHQPLCAYIESTLDSSKPNFMPFCFCSVHFWYPILSLLGNPKQISWHISLYHPNLKIYIVIVLTNEVECRPLMIEELGENPTLKELVITNPDTKTERLCKQQLNTEGRLNSAGHMRCHSWCCKLLKLFLCIFSALCESNNVCCIEDQRHSYHQ